MVSSRKDTAFIRDKYQFFSHYTRVSEPSLKKKFAAVFTSIDKRVEQMGYNFLLEYQTTCATEFKNIFSAVQRKEVEKKELFWLYCYYCASLLEKFSKAYPQETTAKHYKEVKEQIKEYIYRRKKTQSEETFANYIFRLFKEELLSLVNSIYHIAQIRDYIARLNLYRIYWVFNRLTITTGFIWATDWIKQLDILLGTYTDLEKVIANLQAPTYILNYFSVILFLLRFLIDAAMLIKHTFFPTGEEKNKENSYELNFLARLPKANNYSEYKNSYLLIQHPLKPRKKLYYINKKGFLIALAVGKNTKFLEELLNLNPHSALSLQLSAQQVQDSITKQTNHVPDTVTAYDRFKYELSKRHCNFANDLFWPVVNFLTNFNKITHISDFTAGYIVAGCLFFDVCMALYKCNLAQQDYAAKKAQYKREIKHYTKIAQSSNSPAQRQAMKEHIAILNCQLIELKRNNQVTQACFYFIAAAAFLLMAGFTASLLVSGAFLTTSCYFICTLAIAMYLSCDSYTRMQEKSLLLEEAQVEGKKSLIDLRKKEYQAVKIDFIYTMVKNTIMPITFITTATLFWPATVTVAIIYLLCEVYHSHYQLTKKQEINKIAAPINAQDENENKNDIKSNTSCLNSSFC